MNPTEPLRFHSSMSSTFSSPFSVVRTNASNVEDAKVTVFLVNHKAAQTIESIQKLLSMISLDHSILLVEDDRDVDRMSSLLSTECWERIDLQEKMLEEKKSLLAIQETLKNFWNPRYDANLKVQEIQSLYCRVKALECNENFTDSKRVYDCLKAGDLSNKVLKENFNRFLDWFKTIRKYL